MIGLVPAIHESLVKPGDDDENWIAEQEQISL
jgi:hypothetical protein